MYRVGEEIRMSVEEAQRIIDFSVDSVGYWELRSLALKPDGLDEVEYDKLVSDLRVALNSGYEPLSDAELLEKCRTRGPITDADIGIGKRS